MSNLTGGPIQLLITDLDNTLYDWVGSFVPAFYAMIDEASKILNIDSEVLLDEMRIVHQRHGSSEHPFALLESSSVKKIYSDKQPNEVLQIMDPAFHRFNSVRRKKLCLYEGVLDTLAAINEAGTSIVAYTDARINNSLYRLNKLGLDRFVHRLYAPATRFPSKIDPKAANQMLLRVLPELDRKPNPATLLDICREHGVGPHEAIYVGDSLSRDIYMAQHANIRSAWAKYGTKVDPDLWKQLIRVTHWKNEDLAKEAQLKINSANACADIVLEKFADLLDKIVFAPHV